MTSERERRYLKNIRDSIDRVRGYTPSTRSGFLESPAVQDGVVWRLQTIGDAARIHLSDALRQRHPEIPWISVYAFRNIAAHDYAEMDLDLTWEIVDRHLDALYEVVVAELGA